ncbi:MAG TPA: hypothetical protein VKT77_16765, partial [Chthonomonadaceae bacterium]|nr:hypothetical protein [Chthonomonadaceae bacterium]
PAGQAGDGKARLAATIAALGGDAFLNIKQIMMKGEGEISPPGQEIVLPITTATLIFAPPSRSRFELATAAGDVIIGSDGKSPAWLSVLGAIQDGPSGFGDPTELLRRAATTAYPVTLVPDIKGDDGTMLPGFAVSDDQKRSTKVYVDPKSGLPLRLVVQAAGVEVRLGDYHPTENVKLPGSLKVTQGGKALLTLKFSSWAINKPVDDKLFVRPKS